MRLNPTPFSSKHFRYDPKTFTLSCFISDLDKTWPLSRLYDDAADVGIAILSEKTGVIETFYLDRIDEDSEGDIRAWELSHLGGETYKVVIFND